MKTFLTFLLFCLALLAKGQNGITVQLLVSPPYPARLADYAEGGIYYDQGRMVIRLINTLPRAQRVVLRGDMKGRNNNVHIYTTPSFQQKIPIELGPGESRELNLSEANQKFLDKNNLEIAGVDQQTRNQILTTGILPQGLYDLCILAYRYENGLALGRPSQGCASLPITYLEPPRLAQPFCGRDVLIRPDQPMQVVFSWNPPIGNIIGYPITYDFYLVKVPPGQNPNDAINNAEVRRVGNPFVERDLASPFFNYGVAEPPLTDGLYAWRIIARDVDRRAVFQNGGRSEFCTFTVKSGALADLGPQAGTEIVKANPQTTEPKPRITKLPPALIKAFVANPAESPCKDVAAPTDKQPVQANYVTQTVRIGKFSLTIDDATGQNGAYTGNGRIRWNGVPVRVNFEGIQINAAREVIAGWASGINEAFKTPGVDLGSFDLMEMQKLDGNAVKSYVQNLKNNFIEQAKASVAVPLPLGYDTGNGLIGINYMRFTPTGADMGVLFNMELPEGNTYLSLAGTGICMAPDQIIPRNATLVLLKDLNVPYTPLTFRKSNYPALDGTYAILKPDRELDKVHGVLDVNLGSGFLKLDDGNGNPKAGDVVASLTVDFTKWADWVADVNLPNFTLGALAGFSFKGVKTYYDHSDLRNPNGFGVPAEYTGDKGPTFQGLYFEQLSVLMPKGFVNTGASRIGFAARQAIFASGQFTGRLTPAEKPLLDYNTGSVGTWGFSIEEFEVLLVQNRFERGGMNGKLQFPISDDYFTYTCNLRENFKNLQFVVQPKQGGYDIPLWAARMNLYDNSNFLLALESGKTTVDLNLNGAVLINAPRPVSLVLPNLFFEGIRVSNQPGAGANVGGSGVYFNPGNWKLIGGIFKNDAPGQPQQRGGGPADPLMFADNFNTDAPLAESEGGLVGFPITIDAFKFVSNPNGIGLELTASVGVGGGDKTIMNATGTVQVLGTLSLDKGRVKPAFKGVYPSKFSIDGDFGPASVKATLDIYADNPVYGDGFKGTGKVIIPALAAVDATVQFGKKGFYYAYADASIIYPVGIPIAPPTPLSLNGFGGGLYVNMRMDREKLSETITESTAGNNETPGTTNSGIRYIPQQGAWGLKARVYLALTDKHAMISSLEMRAEIQNGALYEIGFHGKAAVMNQDGTVNSRALVKAEADMRYTIPTKTFDLAVDVRTDFFTSSLAVPVRMHFSPDRWHVMAGNPAGERIKATYFKLGKEGDIVHANLSANGYVAFGNDLPSMPPLPTDVERFLGGNEFAATSDDRGSVYSNVASYNPTVQAGQQAPKSFQVLVGAQVKGGFGVSVMPIAISAEATLGFDVAIARDVICDNGEPVGGIAGFYGNGQLYAYFNGGIDIFVDLFFFSGRVKLAELTAGALLRGGVLDPTWVEGKVRAKGEVLGDLIHFNAAVDVAFGKKCIPTYSGDPFRDFKIISELRPTGNTVETDAALSAVFNVNMDDDVPIELPGEVRIYRFRVENYKLEYQSQNKNQWLEVTGLRSPEWSDENKLMVVRNSGHLAGESKHRFSVSVRAFEVMNGQVGDPRRENGQRRPVSETKTVEFTTGKQPDVIRLKDIVFTYPIDGQLYFLKNQVPQGIIVGQLANQMFEKAATYEAHFIPQAGGDIIRSPFMYQHCGLYNYKCVTFNLPPGLKNETVYRLELHRLTSNRLVNLAVLSKGISQPDQAQQYTKTTTRVVNGQTIQEQSTGGLAYTTATNRLSGNPLIKSLVGGDHVLYQSLFRTSRHNTFDEKMAVVRLTTPGYTNATNPNVGNYLQLSLKPEGGQEDFEDAELDARAYQAEAGTGKKSSLNYFTPLRVTAPVGSLPYDRYYISHVVQPISQLTAFGRYGVNIDYYTMPGQTGIRFGYMPQNAVLLSRPTRTLGKLVSSRVNTPVASSPPARTTLANQPLSALRSSSADRVVVAGNVIAAKAINGNTPVSSILNRVPMRLYGPTLNGTVRTTPYYRVLYSRDQVAYHDWDALRKFARRVYQWRGSEWPKILQDRKFGPSVSWLYSSVMYGQSPSISLSAEWRYLNSLPEDALIRFKPIPNTFNVYQFENRQNAQYSRGAVELTYKPYPGAPSRMVRKEFNVPTLAAAPIYLR